MEFCTGLEDKNGNLVYEGDLVKDKYGTIFKIKGGFREYCYDAIPVDEPDDYCFGKRSSADHIMTSHDTEIIGNIHENKELLEC